MEDNQEPAHQDSGKYTLVIIFLLALAIGSGVFILSSKSQKEVQGLQTPTPQSTIASVEELKIEDLQMGTGAEAVAGKKITVHYTGTLTDGVKFDSSLDRGTPFSFTLGAGEVIQGWDKGFAGMKVGGKRKLTIPGSLAYGPNGISGAIPGNATLVFDVELLKVE